MSDLEDPEDLEDPCPSRMNFQGVDIWCGLMKGHKDSMHMAMFEGATLTHQSGRKTRSTGVQWVDGPEPGDPSHVHWMRSLA